MSIENVNNQEELQFGERFPFSVILNRADSRLLLLREKIKSAPFMQGANVDEFLSEGIEDVFAIDEQEQAQAVAEVS